MKPPAVIHILAVALLAAACGFAAEPTALTGPRIQFSGPDYDYGRVFSGTQVEHDFIFTNTGDAQLVIGNVQPGCHCTTAGAYTSQVGPGQTGKIPIRVDTTGFNGPTSRGVAVTSNDPRQPVVQLFIHGNVVLPIEVSPSFVMLNLVPDASSNATQVVHLKNNLDEPLTFSAPVSSQPGVAAELTTLKPGQEFDLVVHTVQGLFNGNIGGAITLKTSSTNTPVVTVNFMANRLPAVVAMPPQLVLLPAGQMNPAAVYNVTIRNNSVKPLAVSDPVVNVAGASVTMAEIEPGRQFSLNLKFPPGFEIPPGANYELTAKSSNPQFAVIAVPIRQIPRPVPPGFTNRVVATNAWVSGPRPMPPMPPPAAASGGAGR